MTHEDTMEEVTEDGFGRRLLSASSIVETQDGQWRFDSKKEVVCIMITDHCG